jgi:acyl-CoA dehydrogenase family protein 9
MFISLSGVQERGEYLRKIGKALRDPIKGFGLLTDYASDWVKDRIRTERIRAVHPALSNDKTNFENWAKNLRFSAERLLMEHGRDIIYREMISYRMADAAIDLFGMIATISRVDTRIKELGEEKCKIEIKICNTFCEQAWRRIRRNLLTIDKNNDQDMKDIADFITEEKQYPFATE